MLATDVRTGKTQILTEEIAEEEARLNGSAVPRAIDDDFDGDNRAHEARIVTQVTTGNDRSRRFPVLSARGPERTRGRGLALQWVG